MPNHSKNEADILSADQLTLARQARQPDLGQLDDTALMQLIADLVTACDAAGEPGGPDAKTAFDFLAPDCAVHRPNAAAAG